ncbi:MAG: sulfur carrier protein ThiS [Opitutales bacterium]|jgi:sulfur carrier protein|nr:sulfur carrier protein ThiS [Opitutales bacterium]
MKVVINDKPQETSAKTLAELVKELGLNDQPAIAIAIGEKVISRSSWAAYALTENMSVLMIRAAQGG